MIQGLYKIFDRWHEQGTVWLISDTHFDDKELYIGTKHIMRANSDDYVKLINSKVGKNDTLIHLGDVGNIEVVKKLKGYKVLICGNHDAGASNYKREIFKEIFDANEYDKKQVIDIMKEKYPNCKIEISNKSWLRNQEVYFCIADNNLFNEIYTGPVIIGEKLILSHEPIHGLGCMMNIHGHVHDPKAKDNASHFNICPDATGIFEPINFNQLMKSGFMSKIESIHRQTIDRATENRRKRDKKK